MATNYSLSKQFEKIREKHARLATGMEAIEQDSASVEQKSTTGI